jgi:hypothetical protein
MVARLRAFVDTAVPALRAKLAAIDTAIGKAATTAGGPPRR